MLNTPHLHEVEQCSSLYREAITVDMLGRNLEYVRRPSMPLAQLHSLARGLAELLPLSQGLAEFHLPQCSDPGM